MQPWDADAINDRLRRHGIEPGAVASRYGATGQGPSIYFDDPEGVHREAERYRAVPPEAMRRFAAERRGDGQRAVVTVVPRGAGGG